MFGSFGGDGHMQQFSANIQTVIPSFYGTRGVVPSQDSYLKWCHLCPTGETKMEAEDGVSVVSTPTPSTPEKTLQLVHTEKQDW